MGQIKYIGCYTGKYTELTNNIFEVITEIQVAWVTQEIESGCHIPIQSNLNILTGLQRWR